VKPGTSTVETLLALKEAVQDQLVSELDEPTLMRLAADWPAWAHEGQMEPAGPYRVWVMLCGRGFGKTRAGAEWVSDYARTHPGASIALVAATPAEVRRVMVEGPRSGLLAVARAGERETMRWEPSLGRLTFASGARAFVYSGAHPDGLRGPEHDIAWCDEFAKWARPAETWTNLQLGLRCGERPRTLVTTTPRAIGALKAILAEEGVARSGGPSHANPHLSQGGLAAMQKLLGGTRTGRQELGGELVEDPEGALWPHDLIAKCRGFPPEPAEGRPALRRVVVGVDPPAGVDGDACGIVVCGVGSDGTGYVVADLSVAGLSPEGWARKVAAAAKAHGAQRIVAEANNGGRMVEAVLRGAGVTAPVRLVHASEGKAARAAPVAVLFDSGRAKLAGTFPALEEELAGLTYGGAYHGPGRSPDRADAMVWALTDLLIDHRRAEPRIRRL
jgi:phage terminase large subunit-like protein